VRQSLDPLPLEQRLEGYRLSSEQALRQASATHDPVTRASLLNAAARWRALAAEIEKVRDFLKVHDAERPAHRQKH
jgi:hypothetical protein